jgi:hypothetical protein
VSTLRVSNQRPPPSNSNEGPLFRRGRPRVMAVGVAHDVNSARQHERGLTVRGESLVCPTTGVKLRGPRERSD